MKNIKRIISMFLAIVLLVTALPLTAIPVNAASNFHITSHDDGENVSSGWITFEWSTYSGAHHYWLTVVNMNTEAKIQNSAIYDTEYRMILSDEDTEYKVYAAAMDANGNVLDRGSAWEVIYIHTASDDIEVSKDELEFDAAGGKDTFLVYASNSWSISDNQSWISVSPTSGSGDKKITVTCKENTTSKDREGTITVTDKSTNEKVTIDVYQEAKEAEPEVTDLSVSKTTVMVGEEYVITIKTNRDASGVVLYVKDANGEKHLIGDVKTVSSETSTTKTFKFDHFFNKTNKTDESGADVSNTRTLYAYPIDGNGTEVLDDSVCDYVNMTVNPAEATFLDFEVKTPVKVTLGNSAVISWEKAVSSTGSIPTYKVYIDNKYYASTTSTSYTLPASYITELGEGDHAITIQATAEGHRAKQSSNHGALVIEEPEKEPEVIDLSVSKTTVTVGEKYVITIKTNRDAFGVVLYVKDTNGEIHLIGEVKTVSSETSTTKTFKFDHFFNKTNKTDESGADVSNTRTLYAYPIDGNGAEVLDDSVCDYVNMTVNPAEATFTDFEVKTPVKVTLGDSAVISWGKAVSSTGSIPTYKVYIDNKYYASTTSTSYTLPASYITELGEGDHAITIQATAEGHRAKQSSNHGALVIEGKPVPATRGDLDGDGKITNKDRFILNRYIEKMTGYTSINKNAADINGDGDVTAADAEYLIRHLAGWIGYEKFPEPPIPGDCTHENSIPVYKSTIFVNNTIKTDAKHYYYHIWDIVCQACGEIVNTIQDEKMGEKTHEFNADGVCSCGAIDVSGYKSWTGINTTGKRVSVYDTPYSADGSYGQLFEDEQVTVLGKKAGRYLVQYAIKGGTKQGYVPANAIQTYSAKQPSANYRLEFKFETITLPVSGREVLLIPKNGSAFYHLYDGATSIWQTDLLKNLTIEFEHNGSVQDDGVTTLTGKIGGFGEMSAYYIVNGEKYNLKTPDYYIVADSNAVYTSGKINVFSQEEKDYIRMALDMYFSQNMINVPYELYWSAWDNFWLCFEEMDEILSDTIAGKDANSDYYASLLYDFLKKYIEAEESNKTVDEADFNLGEAVWELIKFVKTAKEVPENLKTTIGLIKELSTKIDTPDQLKELFTQVGKLITSSDFIKWAKESKELSAVLKKIENMGLSVQGLGKKISDFVTNSKFWNEKAIKHLGTVLKHLDEIEVAVKCGITIFGDWQRHREILSIMLEVLDTIPSEKRDEHFETLREAINLLLEKYDESFWNRFGNGMKDLLANLLVLGAKEALKKLNPGVAAVLEISKLLVSLGDAKETANAIRMRQFYLVLQQGIMMEFESLYNCGDTFSTIYSSADDLIKIFLNMAIHTNELSFDTNGYTEADQKVYNANINNIKTNFKIYLY